MASGISVCSNALLALGAHPINDFSEDTDQARLCANLYPGVRDDLLRAHPWNCAIRRVVLSPLTDPPVFGFRYQFPLPGDLIRVLSVGEQQDDIPYLIESDRLLADVSVVPLRYVFRNENESTWDVALVRLAEVIMQSKIAYAVTGSASLRDALTQEAAYLMRQAKSIDGQEEPPGTLGGYPTLESRF